jgi:uncharacterized protein (TIGR02147 family)
VLQFYKGKVLNSIDLHSNNFEKIDPRNSYVQSSLKKVISYLKQKNNFSTLTEVALHAGVSLSTLTRIQKGQRQLSLELCQKIIDRCELPSDLSHEFKYSVEIDNVKDPEKKKCLVNKLAILTRQRKVMSEDEFKMVAEWYHFAILELAKTKNFRLNAVWISSRLGITELEARVALRRIKNLGILSCDEKNANVFEEFTTTDDSPSQAIKLNHLQNINKSLVALEEDDFSLREFNNFVIAIDSRKISQIKLLIRSGLEKIVNEIQSLCLDELDLENNRGINNIDEVYQLNMQFFKLSKFSK